MTETETDDAPAEDAARREPGAPRLGHVTHEVPAGRPSPSFREAVESALRNVSISGTAVQEIKCSGGVEFRLPGFPPQTPAGAHP